MTRYLQTMLALLLCLTLCLGLVPAACAEEIEACEEEAAIVEVAETEDPPELEEELAAEPEDEPEEAELAEVDGEAEPELLPEPVRVRFLMEREELLSCLSVSDADGQVYDPITDPDTGAASPGWYLLMPGEYVCRFHDETGAYADLEEPFEVGEYISQFISLNPEPVLREYTFSYTWIDPIYADILTEADIPMPAQSPEELLPELRELAASMEGGRRRTDATFMRESGIMHESVETAGAELREQIAGFETNAVITLLCTSDPGLDTWEKFCAQVWAAAIAHTGVPTEGDYLRYEHGGYRASGAIVSPDGGQAYCRIVYSLHQFTTAEQETELTQVVNNVLASLSLGGKNNCQKVLAIYQYLCDNVSYGGSGTLKYTAYSALINRTAYCQGLSAAFYRLCLQAGVDARIISSSALSHAWNIARQGDLYYVLDSTNDLGRMPEKYRFFLNGSESWIAAHGGKASLIGDQFGNAGFAAQYPLSACDYKATVTKQPESVSVLSGKEVSFSVEALGGELQYRWQTLAAGETSWQLIPGAYSAQLTLSSVSPEDNGRSYRCEVSNSAGTVYSDAAVLTVKSLSCSFSLNLAEMIGINFYVGGLDDYTGMTIAWTKKDGTELSMPVTDGLLTSGGNYFFALDTFASKEMTIPIPVTLRDADGTILKQTSCSIRSYCDKVKSLEGYETLKALCQATLDYGSFAQIFFRYRTDDLANPGADPASLPSVPDDFRVTRVGTCTDIRAVSMSLAMEYQTQINIYFYPANAAAPERFEATVTKADGSTESAAIQVASNGAMYVSIPGIAATGLGKTYTVTLKNKTDNSQTTVTASALSYPWMVQSGEANQANLGKALYNYYLKAIAFR